MSANNLHLLAAQLVSQPGNLGANLVQIEHLVRQSQAQLLVLPELFLTGSRLRALFLQPELAQLLEQASQRLCQLSKERAILLGMPVLRAGKLYNGCCLFANGQLQWSRVKPASAMAGELHEQPFFAAADEDQLLVFAGHRLLVLLGNEQAQPRPCDLIINLRSSSFHYRHYREPEQQLATQARQLDCPALLVNAAGAHEQWVYSGHSSLLDARGNCLQRARAFVADSIELHSRQLPAAATTGWPDTMELTYQALVQSIRSYVQASHSSSVLLGLSGGIDSALVLALAVDALGSDKVTAVMMPYHYTAQISQEDAARQAQMLGVNYLQIPIAPLVQPFAGQLEPVLAQWPAGSTDTTEQNLQARSRGMLLMALSNRSGALLLTTSNKSEMAVGYCTLYGDMAGGFAPLKDVPKTLVYQLCNYRNSVSAAIPQRVIDRPPSAELAPDQLDTDSLPDYQLLDEIIYRHIELRQSVGQIIASGMEEATVRRIVRLIEVNEYKRRQSATGPQITGRSFGTDYAMPLNASLQL